MHARIYDLWFAQITNCFAPAVVSVNSILATTIHQKSSLILYGEKCIQEGCCACYKCICLFHMLQTY